MRQSSQPKFDPPLLAVTMGDPAGVGPEVALKSILLAQKNRSKASFLLVGSYEHFLKVKKSLRIPIDLYPIRDRSQLTALPKKGNPVLDLGGPSNVRWGRVSAECGASAVRYVRVAGLMACEGVVDAIVTAPLNKEAIHRAGFDFPGHTELLAELSGTNHFAMMMAGGPFKIVLLSIHTSLRKAIEGVTRKNILEKLQITRKALQDRFGIKDPSIAVAALNPHAGEGGAFGNEEKRIIAPAIASARKLGWRISGPHPPDTLYYWASQGRFDAILAMYHDQGLIPFKLTAFDVGVNVTLGLPIIRTSPDHGTAFDIAGKGKASATSMFKAIDLAVEMALRSRR